MACFNKNIAEYKELKAEFGQDIIVDAAIINYQRATNSNIIPNLNQVQQMQSDMKVMHSTMKREFGQALVKNLINAKLATKKYKGYHYVNATDGQSLLANDRILSKNKSKIYKYLDANNIPAEVITIKSTKKSARIIVNDNLFKINDIVPERRPADTTRTLTIIEHLERMFPQVEVSIVSETQAEQYYNSLDPGQKSRLKFKDIKSYYVNGKAVLIQGRVDSNTAIEEILHPFIDAIKVENSELFDNLLKESKQTFPELKQQIDDAYNDKKGFNQLHRDLELVTQSLTRHFALEYESTPSKSFLDRVNDFIKWFADIIESLHKFITEGGTPVFKVSQIQARTNLSDIAKMLNTTDISFQLEKKADGRVRYALSTEKQRIVNHILGQATTEAQKKIILRLFNIAMKQSDTIDSLSAGPESGESIVILNKEDHTYYDITTGQQFVSATTAINGKLQNELEIRENLAVGNDFDAVVDAILADITADKLFENLQQEEGSKFKSSRPLLDKVYNDLSNYLRGLKADGTVFIPQVVVFDSASGIAGTADIVGITPKGTIKIIDLKTSKTAYSTTAKEMYKRQWNLQNDSLLKQKGVERLSTRGKHGMQVNMYRRMFENMGYEVETGKYAATTFHIQVDISGKGKNQKFLGTYTMGDMISHPPTLNMDYVDKLIPENLDTIAREKIDEIRKDSSQFDPVNDPDFIEEDIEYPTSPEFDQTRYKAVNSNLKNYQKHIRERKKELENYKKRLFVDKTNEQALQYTNNALASIMVALDTTNPDSVALQSNVYSQLIRDAIKEINGFVDFISDAKNFNDPNFITYLMNFKKFAQSYLALKSGSKSDLLNKNELRLVNSLADKLELVEGTNYDEGLIRKAMLDWGVEYTRNNSNKDFTEKELRKLVLQAEDLSFFNLNTRDLATLPDTLLALVAKEFSRARLRGQARADETNVKTRALGNKLYRLDGSKEPRKVFEFMAEMKEGKFTGRFVQKLGDKYWGKHEELRAKLIHENGDWKEYREIGDLETANPLDVEHNLELYRDRQAHSAFWRSETMDEDGNAVAGEYHEYTKEWKDVRSKFMTFVPQGTHGYWIFKSGVTTEQQEQFYLEHYDVVEDGHVMEIKGGEPTGRLIPAELKFPKRKYRQPREDRADIQSDKYNKLMSDNSALGIARRDFYNHYMQEYERQLKKLPMSVRDQMLGYAPIVRGKILADATKKGILPGFLRNMGRNIKDTFTTTQSFRRVATDEYGNLIDSIPIMFVGRPVTQKEIDAVEERIAQVEEARTSKKITGEEYKAEMKLLDGQRKAILGRPNADQVSMDFADSLIKFTAMSSMYEAMDDIEDTLLGIKDIVDQRTYSENQGKGVVKVVKGAKDSIQELAGKRGNKSMEQENTKKRLAAWMSMTFYNSDEMTRTVMDKLTNAAIQYSSLSYVAFNAIGNLNNLAIASANNSIEALGQRFFSRKSYGRANSEFYGLNVGQGIMKRLSYSSRKGGGDRYDPTLPMNKWEGMALNNSMMDAYADIRESIQGSGALSDDLFTLENIKTFGYSLQDAAEYKVQTTVGMAILMDLTMLNRITGDRLSYYDAYDFDSKTQSVKLKDGYDTVVEKDLNGKETLKPFTENYKFDLRMRIREVNKQIHGNYAREDRVILQRHNIGALIFQFKKWLAPAIRARFQREYFDENLGWMEGRYISALRFFGYFFKQVGQANFKAANFKTYMEDQYGKEGQGSQEQERLQNQVLGIKRTFADLSMILAAMISHSILMGLFEDDDDDMDPTLRRLRNLAIYQADRTYKELVMYIPISPTGIVQAGEFISDPIASARNLGQIGEVFTSAFNLSYQNLKMRTPVGGLDGEWGVSRREQRALLNNSSIYYQYKPRKGQLKLRKELFDAIPALYTIQKWQGFLKRQDFYID